MRALLFLSLAIATWIPLAALAEDDPCDETIASLLIDVDDGGTEAPVPPVIILRPSKDYPPST